MQLDNLKKAIGRYMSSAIDCEDENKAKEYAILAAWLLELKHRRVKDSRKLKAEQFFERKLWSDTPPPNKDSVIEESHCIHHDYSLKEIDKFLTYKKTDPNAETIKSTPQGKKELSLPSRIEED